MAEHKATLAPAVEVADGHANEGASVAMSQDQTTVLGEPLPGSWWRHRKGGRYEVIGVAQVEVDLSRVVVYRSAAGSMWTRPVAEFMDGRFARD